VRATQNRGCSPSSESVARICPRSKVCAIVEHVDRGVLRAGQLARGREQAPEHVLEPAFSRRRLTCFDQDAQPCGVQVKPDLLERGHLSPGCLFAARGVRGPVQRFPSRANRKQCVRRVLPMNARCNTVTAAIPRACQFDARMSGSFFATCVCALRKALPTLVTTSPH
jgi:hypothetical protein